VSRFDSYGDEEAAISLELWEGIVSRALGSQRGQETLADIERALVALPEKKLISGALAAEGQVCAVGAYVAQKRAAKRGLGLDEAVRSLEPSACWCGHGRAAHAEAGCTAPGYREQELCPCVEWDPDQGEVWETANAGEAAGMAYSLAWHFTYLNDVKCGRLSDEDRYRYLLAWVRRAQGKDGGRDGN
jgi:hypothetical protein